MLPGSIFNANGGTAVMYAHYALKFLFIPLDRTKPFNWNGMENGGEFRI